jgi:O-antigen/teichoic acid export membrane protein
MKSFSHQATWNTSFSFMGQAISVAFVAFSSRLLGRDNFGYYVWVVGLPAMLVVFDLYLGMSLQNRLTELIATGKRRDRDKLIWGYVWGMLAISLGFIAVCMLVAGTLVAAGLFGKSSGIPSWVIWLGIAQTASVSLTIPLLVVGVGFNAHGEVHRGAAWSLAADVLTKTSFLVVLGLTRAFVVAMASFSAMTLLTAVVLAVRFMRVYQVAYIPPSWALVRNGFHELYARGNARAWAALRVADGLFKNSDIIIAAFVIGSARVGDFAVLDRLSNALMLAANSSYVVLVPVLVSSGAIGEKERMARITARVGRYSIIGLIVFSIIFLTGGERIASLWAGRKIEFSFLVVLLICVRAWSRVLSGLSWHILAGYKLIRSLLYVTLISGFVYAVLYAGLLPRYGVLSIVISQVLAQSVFIILASRFRRRGHAASVPVPDFA